MCTLNNDVPFCVWPTSWTGGTDFTNTSEVMSFSPNSLQWQCVGIPVISDQIDEDIEHFTVHIIGEGVEDSANVYILDDG